MQIKISDYDVIKLKLNTKSKTLRPLPLGDFGTLFNPESNR